jgi:hypothetical protein
VLRLLDCAKIILVTVQKWEIIVAVNLLMNNLVVAVIISNHRTLIDFICNFIRKKSLKVVTKAILTTLFKKYPTLFFPGETSDGRLANLITVVGGPSCTCVIFLRLHPVRLYLLDS